MKEEAKKEFLDIPISVAASLGSDFEKDQVIILTWNREHGLTTVTTWGNTVHDADQAATGGNLLKLALGWPEENCNAISAKVKDVQRDIYELRNVIMDSIGLIHTKNVTHDLLKIISRALNRIDGREIAGSIKVISDEEIKAEALIILSKIGAESTVEEVTPLLGDPNAVLKIQYCLDAIEAMGMLMRDRLTETR